MTLRQSHPFYAACGFGDTNIPQPVGLEIVGPGFSKPESRTRLTERQMANIASKAREEANGVVSLLVDPVFGKPAFKPRQGIARSCRKPRSSILYKLQIASVSKRCGAGNLL